MKLLIKVYIITFIIFMSVCAKDNARKVLVAVDQLTNMSVEKSVAEIITDRLRTELFATGKFTVLERGQMEDILKEQGFQQSGCVSDTCAVEVGQLLGVSQIIAGSIGKIGKTYTINARVIDVASGKIIYTTSTDCKCPMEDILSKTTGVLAKAIAANVSSVEAVDSTDVKKAKNIRSIEKKEEPRIGLKVSLGTVAIGATIAAIVLNVNAESVLDKNEVIISKYAKGYEPINDTDKREFSNNFNTAKKSILGRNLASILAGICATGLLITFTF